MTDAEIMQAKIKELNEIKSKIVNYPSDKQRQKRFAWHRFFARQRIEKLLDSGSFTELDTLVAHHCNDFGMDKKIPTEGVVTGFEKIDGCTVFIYSQDFLALGGS